MKALVVALLVGALLCAGQVRAQAEWAPQIDTKGVDQTQYAKDLADCETYAKANPDTDGKTAAKKGAKKWGLRTIIGVGVLTVATGGLGAIAAIPAMAGSVGAVTAVGAVAGGATEKTVADNKYHGIVSTCLTGRGYHVLGDQDPFAALAAKDAERRAQASH